MTCAGVTGNEHQIPLCQRVLASFKTAGGWYGTLSGE